MTWLITGGSGQLGIAVSRELGRRGILSVSCNSKDLDITKGPIVRDLIADLSPTVVINCAAWTDVDAAEASHARALEVNCEGAKNVAYGAKLAAAKLFQISTDYVFSGESTEPLQTNEIMNPKTIYGRTKAEGERRVLEVYPENSSIIRTAWLYSPWGKNFAKSMTWLAINGNGVVHVVNDQLGQPTSAMDLAKQLIDLGLSSSPVGIYHGTNSGEAT
jgi:dTDP-4-dehydrorhamnose reductase